MVDRVFPVIQPEDYSAFQKLVPGLPSVFDMWNAKHVEDLQDAMRRGERLIEVVVYPDAFAEFLRAHGSSGSPTTLEAFAVEKARTALR
jgi:hypothetical protein